jgi:hypothetical protein
MLDKRPPIPALPRRDELAKFIKNQDTLRRFEQLFKRAAEETPEDLEEIKASINIIAAIGEQLVEAEREIESLKAKPRGLSDQLFELQKSVSELNQYIQGNELRELFSETLKRIDEIESSPRQNFIDELEDLIVRFTLTSGYKDSGNYWETERTGFHVAHGDARNYDDVYPSAVSIGRGASAPASTAYLTGTNFDFLAPEFPSAAPSKEITLHFQIYHSYDEGTNIDTHIHLWIPDDVAGGDIVFDYEYYWSNIGATGTPTTTTGSATLTRAASAGIAQNYLMEIESAISGTGKTISSILSITLSRDTTDTFGSSVWISSDDCHIHKNTPGSRQELTK